MKQYPKSYRQFPQQHAHPVSKRLERLLLVCFYDPREVSTAAEHLAFIQQYSHFSITELNLFEHRYSIAGEITFHPLLNFAAFNGIIIHDTINLDSLKFLDRHPNIKNFPGIKILMQEYENSSHHRFDLVVTGLPDNGHKDERMLSEIERWTERFDRQIIDILEKKQTAIKPIFKSEKPSKNILLLAAHEPIKDPRLSWIVDSVPPAMHIIQLGVNLLNSSSILIWQNDIKEEIYQQKWSKYFDENILKQAFKSNSSLAAIQELREIQRILSLSDEKFCEQYGAPYGNYRLPIFRWYMRYILDITSILLGQATIIRGLQGVIATDLPTLAAALILKGLFNIPVFYDAHEYWPEADIASFEFENEFWTGMEGRLLPHTDYRQTVSSCLAEYMAAKYQMDFESVPNCIPLTTIPLAKKNNAKQSGECCFLFQGNFALGRGLDLLINAWPQTDERAVLLLRGPDAEYKDEMIALAKKTGLLDTRIRFLPAVAESELIFALEDGDVGLIPYMPILANYTNCCPNKMSQYFAAKLPILANKTNFLKEIIEQSQSGIVVDFSNQVALIDSVAQFLKDNKMRTIMGENGYNFFREQFYWEKVSVIFYQTMEQMTANQTAIFEVFSKQDRQNMYNKAKLLRLSLVLKPIIRLVRFFTPPSMVKILKKHLSITLKRKIRFYWE